eukprot:TRINITY_DN17557_c0_g1_i2.p1 TRINITY_DN17557_c0_g1~~TRINITY_DN17557_c0_g1_i2.p1  ORF type:complete len:407 (-),score=19.79 TRINITY_DN17557_c0_g1_i2:41-1261(-)
MNEKNAVMIVQRPARLPLETVVEGPAHDSIADSDSEDEGWSWNSVLACPFIALSNTRFFSTEASRRLLLGVLGCPLAPVTIPAVDDLSFPVRISIGDTPIEASSARYIVQQYVAATGCAKVHSLIKNSFTMGKIKMSAMEYETPSKTTKNLSRYAETGCFVLWQFMPDMWSMELAVGCNKVSAGSDGQVVWRHTPWLGSHAARGPARPLRRVIQGLDPLVTASMFLNARCVGEKRIGEEDCFTLKLAASPADLAERSDGLSEIIRHVLFGHFSQRTGLLVYVEDSHLTRIESTGGDAVYWETTIETSLENYRPVDGILIAHSGRSVVTVFKFGGHPDVSFTKTTMEETWEIGEIVFNVPGLSMDFFLPPADIRKQSTGENPPDPFGRAKAYHKFSAPLKYTRHLLV